MGAASAPAGAARLRLRRGRRGGPLAARRRRAGILFTLPVVALLFLPLLQKRHAMQTEMQRLDTEITRQETLERQQKQEIEALKTDPAYVERTARNKLNLARPNETIFRFEPTPGTPARPR